ncbi:MAG: SAM-dependent methyltransferase [Algiphilus sp.]
MELKDIVPWGRSGAEYARMFALQPEDLAGRRLVSFGDGPSDFNAWARAQCGQVQSVDPLYAFDADAIAERIEAVRPDITKGLQESREAFHWEDFDSPEAMVENRLATMARFLEDYRAHGSDGQRYLPRALPDLEGVMQADLGLCSHLLFLYSAHLDENTHWSWLQAMLAKVSELRIYPLVRLDGKVSEHVAPVEARLRQQGYLVEQIPCAYRVQRDAYHFLRITR